MESLASGINKPRLLIGIDKRLFVLSFVLAFGVFYGCQTFLGFAVSSLLTIMVSAAVLTAAWRLTAKDPQMMTLLGVLMKQKPIYDPGRRDNSRVVIEER